MSDGSFRLRSLKMRLARSVLLVSICVLVIGPFQAQAGTGSIVNLPMSAVEPTVDGVCNPSEYGGAAKAYITVGGFYTFPIFMMHTAEHAYFCFGDENEGLLPKGNAPQVAVYIDRDNDGYGNDSGDDFGVYMNVYGESWARYWGTDSYNGEIIPNSEYQAAIHYYGVYPDNYEWQVEFRLSRNLVGGWKHSVGLALFFHHWWWPGDDYSWPGNGIWASPQWWANGYFTTGNVMINASASIPVVDGQCGAEYADAAVVSLAVGGNLSTGYMEHSENDLYVCLQGLSDSANPAGDPRAVLHINRSGKGGSAPGIDDFQFTISKSGISTAGAGDGSGFTVPVPAVEYDMAVYDDASDRWSAEFRVSGKLIVRWYSRYIDIAVAEQDVLVVGDSFGWPGGYSAVNPNSWGSGYLMDLGYRSLLPIITR